MGCHHSKIFLFYPFFKCHNVFCHIPYRLNGSCFSVFVRCYIKCLKNIFRLCPDCILVCDMICDCPHFFPVKLFCIKSHAVIQIGFINIQIHHSRIRSSDLCDIGITESSSDLCCLTPLFYLRCHIVISTFHNTGDYCMSLSCSFKICNHLSDCSTCIQLAKPCWCICIGIIRCLTFLNIHKNNRYI